MYVLGYFILALAKVSDIALSFYMWIIIGSAILSWVNPDPNNTIVRFIRNATEPVLSRVRGYIPFVANIDFSPVVVIFGIYFIKLFAVNSLIRFANSLL